MLYSRSRTRRRLARRLSWLVIASLTSVALFAPGATSVSAASVAPITCPPISTATARRQQSDLRGLRRSVRRHPDLGGAREDQRRCRPTARMVTITISRVSGQTFNWTLDRRRRRRPGQGRQRQPRALRLCAPPPASAESFGDTGLTQARAGRARATSRFCYDTSNPQPTPTPRRPRLDGDPDRSPDRGPTDGHAD